MFAIFLSPSRQGYSLTVMFSASPFATSCPRKTSQKKRFHILPLLFFAHHALPVTSCALHPDLPSLILSANMKISLVSAAVLALLPYATALSGGTATNNGNVQLQKRNMAERAIVAGHHDSSLNQHEHVKRQRTNRKKECTDSASCRSKYFRPEDFVTTSTTQPATTNPSECPSPSLLRLLRNSADELRAKGQTAILGPTTTTPAPAPTENPGAPVTTPSNCQCGYSISKLNNAYMPGSFNIDFRDTHSVEDLVAAGFVVNNGWQSGAAAADGTVAYGDVANLRFAADGLHFVVPGGQQRGGLVTAAEIQYGNGFTKVYTEAEIQVDATPGTCQALVSKVHSSNKHVQLKSTPERSLPSLPTILSTTMSRTSKSSPLLCSTAAQSRMLVSS